MKRRLSAVILSISLSIGLGLFVFGYKQLKSTGSLYADLIMQSHMDTPAMVYDRHGRAMGSFGRGFGHWRALADLPTSLSEVFIASEDARFLLHPGVDPLAILRAMLANLKAGRIVQGASTLTQQLVRTVLLTRQKTFERKLKEVVLSVAIETQLDKSQILEAYLNRIDFGMEAVGIDAAAHTYFAKSAENLHVAEAAVLAALIRAPSRLNPYRQGRAELLRLQRQILIAWSQQFAIDPETLDDALQRPIRFAPRRNSLGDHAYAMVQVRQEISRLYPGIDLKKSGWQIHSSFDLADQSALNHFIARLQDQLQAEANQLEFGACILDASSQEIRALWGGENYFDSAFNRALQTRRPVGEMYLPFLYALAIERGFHLSTSLYQPDDTIMKQLSKDWPTIFDGLRFRLAYESSRLLMAVGVGNYKDFMQRMQIELSGAELELLVGHQLNSPCGLAAAYGLFRGGRFQSASLGVKVFDKSGRRRKQWPPEKKLQLLHSSTASILSKALALADQDDQKPEIPSYSGFSFSRGDYWAVALLPDKTIAVWVGHKRGHALVWDESRAIFDDEFDDFLRKIVDVRAKLAKMLDINTKEVYFRRHLDLEHAGGDVFLPHRAGRIAVRPE